MRSKTCKLHEGFRVAFDHRGVQAAEMVIAPGDREGGPDNRHSGADQWLFVVAAWRAGQLARHAQDARGARQWEAATLRFLGTRRDTHA